MNLFINFMMANIMTTFCIRKDIGKNMLDEKVLKNMLEKRY